MADLFGYGTIDWALFSSRDNVLIADIYKVNNTMVVFVVPKVAKPPLLPARQAPAFLQLVWQLKLFFFGSSCDPIPHHPTRCSQIGIHSTPIRQVIDCWHSVPGGSRRASIGELLVVLLDRPAILPADCPIKRPVNLTLGPHGWNGPGQFIYREKCCCLLLRPENTKRNPKWVQRCLAAIRSLGSSVRRLVATGSVPLKRFPDGGPR